LFRHRRCWPVAREEMPAPSLRKAPRCSDRPQAHDMHADSITAPAYQFAGWPARRDQEGMAPKLLNPVPSVYKDIVSGNMEYSDIEHLIVALSPQGPRASGLQHHSTTAPQHRESRVVPRCRFAEPSCFRLRDQPIDIQIPLETTTMPPPPPSSYSAVIRSAEANRAQRLRSSR
jgi:hypothetical protein